MNCIEYQFDEVVTLFDKQRVPLSSMERAKRQGKYRYYGAQGIIDYIDDYIFDGEYLLLAEDGENLKSNKQDLAQLVEGKFWVNNHAHILRTKEVCRLRYFYYWINNKNMAEYVTGSAQPKLSQASLKKMIIPLPSLEVQDKILGVVTPIDDKIRENERINENLQAQARALYKAWFIDYVPFRGSCPAGWKTGKLKDVLTLKRNAIKAGENTELPYLPIDVIPMNTFALSDVKPNEEAQSSLITFDKDDIVIGAMRVYFHRVIIAPFAGITRTTCFTLKPSDSDYLCFGLLCCDQDSSIEYAQTTSKGSTMPYAVWDGGLGDMDIVIPDKDTAHEFNEVVMPMIRTIQSSYEEIKHLRDLRDSLLPRLMSGKIDVSELDL